MSRSTQTDIESTLSILWDREKAFEMAVMDDAEAEHLYKLKSAKEYLVAEGTEKARLASATVKCDREYLDHLRKKAVREFTREKLRDAQDALSARQSLLSYEARTNFGMSAHGA